MSQKIIQSLSRLLEIQECLLKTAEEKIELLKNNDVEQLEKLLKKEEKEVDLLEKVEQERQLAVANFMKQHGIESEEDTLSSIVPYLNEEDKQLVQQLSEKLVQTMVELKEYNDLNEQLTKQSLYFVNAQLAAFSPETDSTYAYQHPNQKHKTQQRTQSIFDSKA